MLLSSICKNIQGNLHPLLIISKGYFALLNGSSPFLAFRRKYPFQAYILYGMWERQRPVLVEDKTWIIAPPHTQKKWQGSLLVCSEERSFQCVTIQSRPKPTMHRDTRGKRGEGAHCKSTLLSNLTTRKLSFSISELFNNTSASPMDVISGMATMAMAIPTISFGHRSGHFWP